MIRKNYENYMSDADGVWNARFTWIKDRKDQKWESSIPRFDEATDALSKLNGIHNADDLFKGVESLADEYVGWVKSNWGNYSKEYYEDMHRFFVGAIGEFFFFKLLTDVKCLLIPDQSGSLNRYDFNLVSPELSQFNDYGIDLYGLADDVPSVMQVKFWNRFARHDPGIKAIQGMIADGIMSDAIDKSQNNNAFICFLGNESSIYSHLLKDWRKYRNNVVPLGRKALCAVENRNKFFWESLVDSLKKVGKRFSP